MFWPDCEEKVSALHVLLNYVPPCLFWPDCEEKVSALHVLLNYVPPHLFWPDCEEKVSALYVLLNDVCKLLCVSHTDYDSACLSKNNTCS